MKENFTSHAHRDHSIRLVKAEKISRLVTRYKKLTNAKVLEIGVGSGVIADFFCELVKPKGQVYGVDVIDERITSNSFLFSLVEGTKLPFEPETFDLVITNHVIEHVGDDIEQISHLQEISRVLKTDGIAYLAVPNKYTLIEPHYRLAFLSWLPRGLAGLYLQWSGKGSRYDCYPPSKKKLISNFESANLHSQNLTYEAIRIIQELENPKGFKKIILSLPIGLLKAFDFLIPTRIFVLSKSKPA